MFVLFGLSGLAAGFLAGLFGIGGGLIMVPVLVYAFTAAGFAAQHVVAMALGTSMAAIVFSAAQSAYGHYRLGSASAPTVCRTAPWAIAGVTVGTVVAAGVSRVPLLIFVGCFQFVAAALMLSDVSKYTVVQALARQSVALRACAVAIGGVAAMAGIGGGTLFTPFLRASGMDTRQAIGTSAALGLPVSIAGAASYASAGYGLDLGGWTLGYVHLPALLALVLGSVLTVRLGVAAAHQVDARALSRAFAVFLVLNGARLMASAL